MAEIFKFVSSYSCFDKLRIRVFNIIRIKSNSNLQQHLLSIQIEMYFRYMQRVYRGEGFSALFTFCPNCPAIISPRILGKIGAVVGVPRACQKFWGFFCLVVCSSQPDGSGRLMEGPTWQMQNVNKAEKHTPKQTQPVAKVACFQFFLLRRYNQNKNQRV